MKHRCAPSSNNIAASVVMCPEATGAMAVSVKPQHVGFLLKTEIQRLPVQDQLPVFFQDSYRCTCGASDYSSDSGLAIYIL